jgi:DNA invertase Pin-like site-specific DNA recombinase
MNKYIAYYRVSTQKQGKSGLGLAAQRDIINRYIAAGGQIICEYKEIESGKNSSRVQLQKAIEQSKQTGATLLIAKLDRLSRNVSFIFDLRDSKVNFICCDIPDMNTLTIGIFATMAQHERELISKRTKDALSAKKAAGAKLGNPNGFTAEAQTKATRAKREKAKNNELTAKAKQIIKDIIELHIFRKTTLTIEAVSAELNRYETKTSTGKAFTKYNVRYILDQVLKEMGRDKLPRFEAQKTIVRRLNIAAA